jgi:ferredoxin
MVIYDFLVIGSGPSATGFLSSSKLVNKRVCVVDSSFKYKNEFSDSLNENNLFKIHDINNKGYFGQSDATTKKHPADLIQGLDISNSLMAGGLSNVWGAACTSFKKETLTKMGLNHDISKQKIFIENLLGVSNYALHNETLEYQIFEKLSKENSGNYIKESRLAINQRTCTSCGFCLYGCPQKSIYNSYPDFLRFTAKHDKYLNFHVLNISLVGNKWLVNIINNSTNEKIQLITRKLILGCGAINTSKLLIKSLPSISSIQLSDSQCFYFPIFYSGDDKYRKKNNALLELANFFIESKYLKTEIHGQFYRSGPYVKNQIKKMLGLNLKILDPLFKRFFIYQGYLPSSKSSTGEFVKDPNGNISFMVKNKYDNIYLTGFIEKISKDLKAAGLYKPKFISKILPIYAGYHFGSINIRLANELIRPDTSSGVIPNIPNLHIVDASIFRELPSGPYTLYVMANAKFIADSI